MNKIIIKSQSQFDKLPKSFKEETWIYIECDIYEINKNIENGTYIVYGNAVIEYVYDNAVIKSVSDNAVIKSVSDNAVIKSVSGNAVIKSVSDNAVIKYVSDNAVIKSVSGNAVIKSVSGNAVIESVSGNAVIKSVSGNAVIKSVSGNAVIESVYGNAVIEYVYGNAVIEYVSDNAVIKLFTGTVKKASKDVVIICQDYKPQLNVQAQVVYTKTAIYTKKDFINLFSIDGKKLILYKSVELETELDFYTHKIKYEDGKIVKPEIWNSSTNIECGDGLHLCPTPELTQRFNTGKIKVCEVDVKDIVVYKHNINKVRCKKVKVIGDYNEE